MANKKSATFEERVDQSALDLNDIVKLLRDISYTGETKLGGDAIDAGARSVEQVEIDLWALKNDMERLSLKPPAQAA